MNLIIVTFCVCFMKQHGYDRRDTNILCLYDVPIGWTILVYTDIFFILSYDAKNFLPLSVYRY